MMDGNQFFCLMDINFRILMALINNIYEKVGGDLLDERFRMIDDFMNIFHVRNLWSKFYILLIEHVCLTIWKWMILMRILLYGAGADATGFLRSRSEFKNIFDDVIVAWIDSDNHKWGRNLAEWTIDSPERIGDYAWEFIVIVSKRYLAEIRKGLIDKYKVKESSILSLEAYVAQKLIHYQYKMNLKKNDEIQKNFKKFNRRSFVVYTAIFGDYDELREPLMVEPGVRYICFTDQKHIKSKIWDVKYIKRTIGEETALWVRRFKMLPHKYFPDFDTSLWIDASFVIKKQLSELFAYQQSSNFLLFPHPARICAYEEAADCILWKFAPKRLVLNQIKEYVTNGYPENNGLFMGSLLLRNHNDENVIATMEEWFAQVVKFSKRDQISLPYAIWKTALPVDLIDMDVFDNPWMLRLGHKNLADSRGSGDRKL